ncbi:hypothetical protein A0H81_09745 [Grifola frondosa]|uniref:AB hydrolase-1 domain-containing protein n=1 Tax=Grifola frondosa TaxID=5627 RepID=A0A1C7M177_GRIFR|nr:hypothetical protein A0H81_09745 [Grifola frondosa]
MSASFLDSLHLPIAMSPSSTIQWVLLVLPAITILAYCFAVFPHSPDTLQIQPSLAILPKTSASWSIYPENFFQGGAYVRFPYGTVRYWLIGPESGRRVRMHPFYLRMPIRRAFSCLQVVLIHGLSVPAIIWRDVAPQLATKGFRVLLYDLYGRGYSDAPQTTYDINLYNTQLALLLQYVGWDKVNVIGVSMGGGIAAAFNAQFPHLVADKTVLVCPAGLVESGDMSRTTKFLSSALMQFVTSSYPFRVRLAFASPASACYPCFDKPTLTFYSLHISPFWRLFNLRIISALALISSARSHLAKNSGIFGLPLICMASTRMSAPLLDLISDLHDSVQSSARSLFLLKSHDSSRPHPIGTSTPGYNRALASSIRDGPLRNLAPEFAALGRHSRKAGRVLIIWGTADNVVPYRYAARVQALVPHAELVTIEGGAHDITLSHPDEVLRAVLEFFKEES